MTARIVLFGATGATGRLVAAALAASGARPTLAARDAGEVARLAQQLGGLEHAQADARRPETLARLLGPGDVLVSTVGPFSLLGEAAVDAAIGAGAVYLDCTGEPAFIRRLFEDRDDAARRANAALLPAMGYDYAPGSLAAALALDHAGETAVRADVGYFVLGSRAAGLSRGTRSSAAGVFMADSFALRDGRIRSAPFAERIRSFEVEGRRRDAVSIGGAEHFALRGSHPRLREVNVYLGWFEPLAGLLHRASPLLSLTLRLPAMARVAAKASDVLTRPRGSRGATPSAGEQSLIVATAHDASGRQLAEVRLRGAEPYAFTAGLLAWAARAAASGGVSGAGVLGPVQAFGMDRLLSGCAEAGVSVLEERWT